jgi:hypothetical protein
MGLLKGHFCALSLDPLDDPGARAIRAKIGTSGGIHLNPTSPG